MGGTATYTTFYSIDMFACIHDLNYEISELLKVAVEFLPIL